MSILKLKNSQGNWIGVPTLKGDKGNGISSAILNNDYTLTLTFTDGTTYTTPSIRGEKGEQGEPATDMDIHICSSNEYDSETRIPTITSPDDKTFYLVPTEDGTNPDLFTEWVYVNNAWEMFGSASVDLSGYLTDVTVDGTSVVTDGVAEIPVAGQNINGFVNTNDAYGIATNENGRLFINAPSTDIIKQGISIYRPIVPARQNASTFYGLAGASGDITQKSSSNPVGQYTDEAKSSIQNMLGITDKYTPKDWMAESETELVTNAHSVGDLFYIGETLYKVIADLNAGDAINVGVNVEEVNVNDILTDYATKEDVENNVSIVEKNASGSIASFDDGMDDMPLKSLTVDINPVQDLHGYDSPWVGGGGKNLFNKEDYEYKKYLNHNNGNANTSTGNPLWDTSGYIKVTPGMTYVTSPWTVTTLSEWCFYDADKVFISGKSDRTRTATAPENAAYVRVDFLNTVLDTFQLEEGSTATAYAPYENICPISGWTGMEIQHTGKNLFDASNPNTVSGYIGTTTFSTGNTKAKTVYIPIKPNTTYTVSKMAGGRFALATSDVIPSNGAPFTARQVDANMTVKTITSGENDAYLWAWVYFQDTDTVTYEEMLATVQIESGSTATAYELYNGTTIPISWQTEAGTVYGGSLDVLSGAMTVDRIGVDLSAQTWSVKATGTTQKSVYTQLPMPYVGHPRTSENVFNPILERYTKSGTGYYSGTSDAKITNPDAQAIGYLYYSNSSTTRASTLYLIVDVDSTPSGMIVYNTADATEIRLSPTEVKSLLGQNNIFADTGDTEIEYFSYVDTDLTDYININLKSYAKKSELPIVPISDVQINGNSIVNNNIVEIPLATDSNYGLVSLGEAYGIKRWSSEDPYLMIDYADETAVKNGQSRYRPITPLFQDVSTFYGLATAAGVDMASSSNTVGTYTDEAKTAIKTMLGVHDTYDSFIEEIIGTDVTITGQPSYRYNCGEVLSLSITPPESGTIDIRFTSGSTPTVLTLPQTVKMPEWWIEVEANTIYEMCITDGIYCGVMTWAM